MFVDNRIVVTALKLTASRVISDRETRDRLLYENRIQYPEFRTQYKNLKTLYL